MEDLGLVMTLRGVASPSMKLLVAQSTIFECFVVRAHLSRNVCACWRAECFFFCRDEARTLVSRERYGHLVLLSSVSAWAIPTRSQP